MQTLKTLTGSLCCTLLLLAGCRNETVLPTVKPSMLKVASIAIGDSAVSVAERYPVLGLQSPIARGVKINGEFGAPTKTPLIGVRFVDSKAVYIYGYTLEVGETIFRQGDRFDGLRRILGTPDDEEKTFPNPDPGLLLRYRRLALEVVVSPNRGVVDGGFCLRDTAFQSD